MRVGYKLRREIEDLFPGACTPAERLVALEIADFASEDTHVSRITLEKLCWRTGLTPDGVKHVLQRLNTQYGLQFRVSKGKGKDGRDVYSARGYSPEYRVPFLDEFRGAHCRAEGGTTVPPSAGRRDHRPAFRPRRAVFAEGGLGGGTG